MKYGTSILSETQRIRTVCQFSVSPSSTLPLLSCAHFCGQMKVKH